MSSFPRLVSMLASFASGVCRTLGQGEVGYVATTHTMSGVYRKWDYQARNPAGAWKNIATTEKLAQLENTSRVVPGATSPAKGQVRLPEDYA